MQRPNQWLYLYPRDTGAGTGPGEIQMWLRGNYGKYVSGSGSPSDPIRSDPIRSPQQIVSQLAPLQFGVTVSMHWGKSHEK